MRNMRAVNDSKTLSYNSLRFKQDIVNGLRPDEADMAAVLRAIKEPFFPGGIHQIPTF